MEAKGKGAASATITSWLEPGDGATTVKMQADITMTGAVAQLSRGLLPDVSKRLTAEFADRLRAVMGGGPVATEGGNSIDALGLGVKAVGGAMVPLRTLERISSSESPSTGGRKVSSA